MAKGKNTFSQAGNPQLGALIAGQQLTSKQSVPNEYDVDAQLFSDIKNQFSGGKRGARGIDALVSGLATGAEYGSKLQGVGLRKKELEDYNEVMDYFSDINMEAQELNRANMQKEAQRESLMPYGLAGMELAYSDQPYAAVDTKMRGLFEQAQDNNPDIKGRYIGFIPNTPNLIVRDENGQDSVWSLSAIVGEEGTKRIQGDWIDRQKLGQMQQGIDIQRQNANINQEYLGLERQKLNEQPAQVENKYQGISLSMLDGRAMGKVFDNVNAAQNKTFTAPQIFKGLKEGKEIIRTHPNIGTALINLIGTNSFLRGIDSLVNQEDREAYEKLDKIASRSAEAFIQSRGLNVTDSERELIKKSMFSVEQSAAAKEYNIKSIEDELSKDYLRGKFTSDEFRKGFYATPQGFEQYLSENPNAIADVRKKFGLDDEGDQNSKTNQGVRVKDPKTGETQLLSSENAKIAESRGGIVVK